MRRPRRPHHGLGTRELRAQRRPELGLPRLPRLLSKLPPRAPLCDIVRLPPSLGSAPAAPGHLRAPASCVLRPHCGEAGVELGLRAAWQAAVPAGPAGAHAFQRPCFPTPAPLSNLLPPLLRLAALSGWTERIPASGPQASSRQTVTSPTVSWRPHNLERALMGNLGPLWPRSPLHPQALWQPMQSALPTWEGGGHGAGPGSCPTPTLRLVPSCPLVPSCCGKAQAVVHATSGPAPDCEAVLGTALRDWLTLDILSLSDPLGMGAGPVL